MKLVRFSNVFIFTLFCVVSLAHGTTNVFERTALSSRTRSTWEGVYTFSTEFIVKIHEIKDLHVLTYQKSGSEGVLVDFAEVNDKGEIEILLEMNANPKGAVPVLDGVDVFPGSNEAEVIVRWRHLGNGGFRSVEKYQYTAAGVELITRSEFMSIGGETKWISKDVLEHEEAEMKKKYPAVREAVIKKKRSN